MPHSRGRRNSPRPDSLGVDKLNQRGVAVVPLAERAGVSRPRVGRACRDRLTGFRQAQPAWGCRGPVGRACRCVAPTVGRACRDRLTGFRQAQPAQGRADPVGRACLCVAPTRRSSLSRPREGPVCRAHPLVELVETASPGFDKLNQRGVVPIPSADRACVPRPPVGRACRDRLAGFRQAQPAWGRADPVGRPGLCVAPTVGRACRDRLTGFRQAQPAWGRADPVGRGGLCVAPIRWSSLSRPSCRVSTGSTSVGSR